MQSDLWGGALLRGNVFALGHDTLQGGHEAQVHYHLTLQEGSKIILKYPSIVSVFFHWASWTLGKA